MSTADVTPAEIARLAGVGRAAVSNWRRRYPDFPQPVSGTASSPRFALAEIEQWLRRQGKLAELPPEERVWQQIRAHGSDHDLPAAMVRAGELLTDPTNRRGADDEHSGLRESLAVLSAQRGVCQAFELLLARMHEAARVPRVPDPLAELMVALLGPVEAAPAKAPTATTIYDPACGTGGLLLAALERFPHATLHGDETDPDLRALAGLRATAHQSTRASFTASGLRHPTDPPVHADAVLCAPLYADRDWVADDLAYDPRWRYGVPPKAEPELAWVQHTLAHLRPGGRAVLLLPPAVAARASGRRIRAELLRGGALHAVVGLPAGAAPPHSLPLHLWLLRQPLTDQSGDQVLIADLSPTRDSPTDESWTNCATALLKVLDAMDRGIDVPDTPTVRAQVVRVMDLLDDAVDLTPARRLRSEPAPVAAQTVLQLRDRLKAELHQLHGLLPGIAPATAPESLPMITIGDLARTGALSVSTQHTIRGQVDDQADPDAVPVWRARDVIAGHGPAGSLHRDHIPPSALRVDSGDVVAPIIGHQLVARVVTDAQAGAVLGPNLYLLRPDPDRLDPWFLAGFLRRDTNTHRASSLGSINRYDIRRAHVPRIPVEEQRRHGLLFQRLAEFDQLMHAVATSGEEMIALITDGLATGTLRPR